MDKVRKILDRKNIFTLFIFEWILSTCFILIGLRYVSLWWYHSLIHIGYLIFFILDSYIFIMFLLYLFKRINKRIDLLFVYFMIPLGLAFTFAMLPDFVPDEQSHFQRAYLLSNFDFRQGINVYVDSDYAVQKIKSYDELFKMFYINFHPSYTLQTEAANYHFMAQQN